MVGAYTKIIEILNQELTLYSIEAKINIFGAPEQNNNGIYFYNSPSDDSSAIPKNILEQQFDQLQNSSLLKIQLFLIDNGKTQYIPLSQCQNIKKLLEV